MKHRLSVSETQRLYKEYKAMSEQQKAWLAQRARLIDKQRVYIAELEDKVRRAGG